MDILYFFAAVAFVSIATELIKAVGDLVLIASNYLLQVGEYTVKDKQPNSKQTQKV